MRSVLILMILVPVMALCDDWDQNYIAKLYDGRRLDPIEGVWQFAYEGAQIAIVQDTETLFSIYVVDTPRLDVKPGTMIGTAVKSPRKGYYDGTLHSKELGKNNKIKGTSVTFTVNDEGTLTIQPYKTGYDISFRRWISSILHIGITSNADKRPKGLDGARRVYPYIISDHYPICL